MLYIKRTQIQCDSTFIAKCIVIQNMLKCYSNFYCIRIGCFQIKRLEISYSGRNVLWVMRNKVSRLRSSQNTKTPKAMMLSIIGGGTDEILSDSQKQKTGTCETKQVALSYSSKNSII